MATCGACGKDNPDGFQFCGFCGAALAAGEAAAPTRERKVVTVLFCDLVGFTAASESADPEEVQARIAPYHARTRDRIEAFGGTVEKFIGDAVMAVFGAPLAFEDDAERAVRAGLAILEGIEELNTADGTLELSVRIGVNTGEAVVSLDSRPEQGEGMVTGDVVNTAARIQAAAPVDGIAVGEATYRVTDRVFEYEPLEPITAKGKSKPVQVWRAIAPIARFGSDVIRSLTTPLVGRETDLALLRSLFDKTANDREMQLVTVVGEPGVGKSRLVAELFAYIDELQELVTWRQGRCLPYGDGITFWALGEILKAHAGIYESDSADEATAKLDAYLPEGDGRAWLRARLLPLLGIESGQSPSREESFTAWRRFLEDIAEGGPLVIIVEDVHWADEALLAFLEHLADWARGVPMLVVCTARPELYERHPGWGAGLSNQTSIRLSPLSDIDTARLVSALLEQSVLPAETQRLLIERAGGNPLYAEEFVRMLRDRDLLDERGALSAEVNVAFPDSIQALIAARLDTLPADRKLLLQDAAVVGKVFWAGAVARIGERAPGEVEAALHELSRKELVRPARQSSMESEVEYGFWHALVRDVAYQQIPRAERAGRHVAVASWIEERAGERVEDLADVLLHHYETAVELFRTTGHANDAEPLLASTGRYLRLAAERAAVLDAQFGADLYARALTLVPLDDETGAAMLLAAADTFRQAARYVDAEAALTGAESWYRQAPDVTGLVRTLLARSVVRRYSLGRGPTEPVLEAIELLDGARTPELVAAYARMASLRYVAGHDREALDWAVRSNALARELGVPEEVGAVGVLGGARAALGDRGGLDELRRAVEIALEREQSRDAALWLNNLATAVYPFEGSASALAAAREGASLAESRGITETAIEAGATCLEFLYDTGAWDELLVEADALAARVAGARAAPLFEMKSMVADVLLSRGDFAGAAVRVEGLVESARELGDVQWLIMCLSPCAAVAVAVGDASTARALMGELLAVPDLRSSYNFPAFLPKLVRNAIGAGDVRLAEAFLDGFEDVAPMHRHARRTAEAQIAEARGEFDVASAAYAGSAEAWEEFGFVPEHALALLGQGRCEVALGEPGADRSLRDARAIFDGLQAREALDECDLLIARASKLTS